MTRSGQPSTDDPVGGQAEIWEAAGPSAPSGAGVPSGSSRPREGGPSSRLADTITSTERVPGPQGFYYADVPNRVIAMIVDIIVLSVVGFILALLFGGLVTPSGALDSPGGELDVVPFLGVTVLQLLISLGYFAYLWVAFRGTIGMKLLGLQIGNEVDGHAIDWRHAAIRWLIIGIPSILASLAAYVPSVIGVVLTVIGLAWLLLLLYSIAQSPTKQGLHDRYAHTIMVKRGRRAA